MGLFGKLFGGTDRNQRLVEWAKSVSITEKQLNVMHELWEAGQQKRVPDTDPLTRLEASDREYINKICGADFRPREFGSANTLRLSSWRYLQDLGFSGEQSAILVGMMFNMVGREDI